MVVEVYRYEHPSNTFGPYGWRWTDEDFPLHEEFGKMLDDHSDDDHPALPWEEALIEMGYSPEEVPRAQVHLKFGCVTEEALDRWFDGYHDLLKEAGFVRARYLVPEDEVTKPDPFGQVAFISEYL